MIKASGRKIRLHVLEALEDRAVPSAPGVTASAATTTPPSPTTAQVELTQVEDEIEGAYAGFASGVYSDEQSFDSLPNLLGPGQDIFVVSTPPGAITSTGALLTAIDQEITTLEQALTTTIQGSVLAYSLGLVQAQINGSTAGSLASGVAEVLNAVAAASIQGYVSLTETAVMNSAIDNAIAASYQSVTLEAYLFANGKAPAAGSNFNLVQVDGKINAAYGSVATTITQAESNLYLYPTFGETLPDTATSPTGQVTYHFYPPPADEPQAIAVAADVVSVVDSQVGALGQADGSLISGTSVASSGGLVRAQIDGTGSSSLLSRLNSLYAAAAFGGGAISPDGAIPIENVGVLVAAVDAAIAASYSSTAVETTLIGTS